MKYLPPLNGDENNPNRGFINAAPVSGVEGSIPPAEGFEHPQREIVSTIEAAGLTPDGEDLSQLALAISIMIANAAPTLSSEAIYSNTFNFEGSVADGDVVYFHGANAQYEKAVANLHLPAGIADITNGRVYFAGLLPDDFYTGLTPGVYWLSEDTAGALVNTEPTQKKFEMGKALAANRFLIDIDLSAAKPSGISNRQIFTANGNFVVPAGVETVRVSVSGGGGGGGGAGIVGPDHEGQPGGSSSFGAYMSATGGEGGSAVNQGIGGLSAPLHGIGAGGDIILPGGGAAAGGPGHYAGSNSLHTALSGGAGGLVEGDVTVAPGASISVLVGGGGQGGLGYNGGSGGDGSNGYVIVEW